MDTLKLVERVSSDNLSIEEYDKAQEALGVFMLISSKPIDPKEVLPFITPDSKLSKPSTWAKTTRECYP